MGNYVMNEKAGNKKMQVTEVTESATELKWKKLTGQVTTLIQDRTLLINCLVDLRRSLSTNSNLKVSDLMRQINVSLDKVYHEK